MILLIFGVLLWSVAHLIPSAAPQKRSYWIEQHGEGKYKGLFSLAILASLLLIVFGWRSTLPEIWYIPSTGLRHVTMLLMMVSFILLGASQSKGTRIKQWIRHPQLTAVAVWAFAHLLSNGEARSVILFGGLLIWAELSIIFINKRDGKWEKPTLIYSWPREAITLVISLVLYAIVAVFLHQYIAGLPIV
ncbi:NnrU protein [Vibrio sp. qd031]|uniref:NnrU family protein n=1 Tax=Vibrio sp. qd031 TaxID=1603038 RepID=UPI000A0FFECB|nr:NnrU family protein [Vibrio sp. qd031]ORT48263.1 NnrU protein [Vibrio sp. qd031]